MAHRRTRRPLFPTITCALSSCVALQTNWTGELFIHKDKGEFGLCTAHTDEGLQIRFPFMKRPFCWPMGAITVDKILLRVRTNTDRYMNVIVNTREAEICDTSQAVMYHTVRVKYINRDKTEDVDIASIKWRSTHGNKKKPGDGAPSAPSEKRQRIDKELRNYLSSIDDELGGYADKLIELGFTNLNHLQNKIKLAKLEEICDTVMPPAHLDMFVEGVKEHREATSSAAICGKVIPPAPLDVLVGGGKERREAGWACGSSTVQPAVATDLARRAAQIAADAAAEASGKAPGRAELIHP